MEINGSFKEIYKIRREHNRLLIPVSGKTKSKVPHYLFSNISLEKMPLQKQLYFIES